MQSASSNEDKVSVKQLIMLVVVMTISPTVRFLPAYAAKRAEEAGWLTPFAAIPLVIANILLIHSIFNKYQNNNAADVIKDILGKYIGTAALSVHLAWILLLSAFFTRFNAERLVSSIYPNIDMNFFIVITITVSAYLVHSGRRTVARMGEVLFPILIIILCFVLLLLLPNIRLDALLPVSFSDIWPIMKGSMGTLAIYSYLFVSFLFSDNIVGQKNIKKLFFKGSAVLFVLVFLMLLTTFGMLGHTVIIRAPIPFLITVKQISLLDTIENIESVAVATWMLSDAVLVAAMSIITLNIAKAIFNLSDTKHFTNIFFVLLFILSNGIAQNRIELDFVAGNIVSPINFIIGFGTPLLLFVVGKLRHKL